MNSKRFPVPPVRKHIDSHMKNQTKWLPIFYHHSRSDGQLLNFHPVTGGKSNSFALNGFAFTFVFSGKGIPCTPVAYSRFGRTSSMYAVDLMFLLRIRRFLRSRLRVRFALASNCARDMEHGASGWRLEALQDISAKLLCPEAHHSWST